MLLSRVAEQLHWAARYVERAEVTARVVKEHTHVLVDLPTWVPLTWSPLLRLVGSDPVPSAGDNGHGDDNGARGARESDVVAHLVADDDNPSSLRSAVTVARQNLRSSREVLPREAWLTINNLYLYVSSHHGEGVNRWSRGRFLDRVVAETQLFAGIVGSAMGRDEPYRFLRLGRSLERVDMVTRVIDGYAPTLLTPSVDGHHVEVQWAAVLRALSALQPYYRAGRAPLAGRSVVGMVLRDPGLPGSAAHCLADVRDIAAELPNPDAVQAAVDQARDRLADVGLDTVDELRAGLSAVRDAAAAVHDEVEATWFPMPDPADEVHHLAPAGGQE